MAHDMDFCLRTMLKHKGNISKWRQERFEELVSLCNDAQSMRSIIEDARSMNSKLVSAHIDIVRNLVAAESAAWPDRTLTAMLTTGATPLGIAPVFA